MHGKGKLLLYRDRKVGVAENFSRARARTAKFMGTPLSLSSVVQCIV